MIAVGGDGVPLYQWRTGKDPDAASTACLIVPDYIVCDRRRGTLDADAAATNGVIVPHLSLIHI